MVNQQLLDYIKQQSQQGINNEQIKQSLLANGWQSADVEEAFNTTAQVPIQPKKRKWKKIVLIIVAIIIFLFLFVNFLPSVLGLFSKDIVSIDDSDLRLKNITVSQSDNAYFDLVKLENIIYEPAEKSNVILDIVAGKTWDDNLAEEIVSRNSQAFGYFSEAAHKSKFQDPAFTDPSKINFSTVLPSMNNWRIMARLSAIKALYLARQGKDKEAMDEALNAVRIGQKIQDSQVPLIEYLVAIAMKGIGLETVQKVIVSSKLSSTELSQYNQELNQFYKNEDGLITAFKGEYYNQSWAIDAIVSGNKDIMPSIVSEDDKVVKMVKNNYYFQPNKTKAIFAEYTRTIIKNTNKFCGEIQTVDVQRLAPSSVVRLYITENAVGKILHDIVAVSLTGVSTKKCQEDLLVGATQAMIAIKAFKNDTGNYPNSLNELVPNYLSLVPQDPFDGKSLKYSAAKKILYSVGEDMQDSGGSAGDGWRKMTDPTFKINF